MVKADLIKIVKEHKFKYNLNIMDEMARTQNKSILRLPPYHCELNPIELILADIKQYVASNNSTFKTFSMMPSTELHQRSGGDAFVTYKKRLSPKCGI
nr:unnamed protein product [Callosobruchus chinensis]